MRLYGDRKMSLFVSVGNRRFEIGSASFLKAWFSTIYIRLEHGNWGSRFPLIMKGFYSGSLPLTHAAEAKKELLTIRDELSEFLPNQIVWDFEDLNTAPPWGNRISPAITSLGNYFVTSDGKDLFDVLLLAFEESAKNQRDIIIS